jgi:hypothetical protein
VSEVYATLTDTVTTTTVNFVMNPDWKPDIKEVGGLFYPLGYPYAVKTTDGTKGIGGTLTIVAVTDEMDDTCQTLFQSTNVLELTMPNGDTYYIVWNPATDRKGSKTFSYMVNNAVPPINTWTADYVQVAAP